jgi:hypothetical protein
MCRQANRPLRADIEVSLFSEIRAFSQTEKIYGKPGQSS